MPDLDLQIRSYFEATTRPIDVDELISDQPPVTTPMPGHRSSMHGLLIAIAVAVVITITLAVVFLLPGSDTPPVAPPTNTTIQRDQTTTLPPSTTLPPDEEAAPPDPQSTSGTTTTTDPPMGIGVPTSIPPADEGTTPEGFDVTDWIAVYENPANGGASILSGIRIIHPDGRGLRHDFGNGVANGVGMMPDWSPDGTRLALARRAIGLRETVGSDQLFEVDLATRSTRLLFACAEPCISDWYPAYSPDGSQMAFTRLTGNYLRQDESDGSTSSVLVRGSCGIWVGSLASLEVEQITSDPGNPGCTTTSPRWSPSGDKLVYARTKDADSTIGAIFVIDLTTREVTQLTDFGFAADPDWSPDGEWIVFGKDPSQWWDPTDMIGGGLYRIRPDGTDLQQLPSPDASVHGASRPRYTPDGQWITYAYGNDIWVVPADGGRAIRLITGGRYAQADWQP